MRHLILAKSAPDFHLGSSFLSADLITDETHRTPGVAQAPTAKHQLVIVNGFSSGHNEKGPGLQICLPQRPLSGGPAASAAARVIDTAPSNREPSLEAVDQSRCDLERRGGV